MIIAPTPENLKGLEFERMLSSGAAREEKNGYLTMDHYGVTMSVQNGIARGIPSKPDFEGVLSTGRQFIIEAKVCSSASFPLTKDKIKPRQVSYMLKRSKFNVPCYIIIHWNARKLAKSKINAITVAIRVSAQDPRWQRFIDAHAKAKRLSKESGSIVAVDPQGSISLDEAMNIGTVVNWVVQKGCRKPIPDIISLIWPDVGINSNETLQHLLL